MCASMHLIGLKQNNVNCKMLKEIFARSREKSLPFLHHPVTILHLFFIFAVSKICFSPNSANMYIKSNIMLSVKVPAQVFLSYRLQDWLFFHIAKHHASISGLKSRDLLWHWKINPLFRHIP